ncbi:uncharacterized protein LOC124273712 isoform X3 [Haliotis rubra]|uniref:uncharacterized protein LOC124273712 isoform X3 n=1 Tax=Haliotis rubra TaxID=36100 RepID=UPI001EE5A648|nr:uncharacterized protein LOC124273712 isoform X3 [Haliotis rubra]
MVEFTRVYVLRMFLVYSPLILQSDSIGTTMSTEERRLPYAREFVRSLAETTDDREREVQEFLLETMLLTLAEVETRFRTYMQKLHHVTGEQNFQTMRSAITRMEKQINSRFHTKDSFGNKSKVSHIHREALRNCYTLLTSDLELFKSSIIDDLLSSDVMSVSDKDSIRGKDTRRGQNEEFFGYIVGRLSFEDFHRILLPALRKDHPHVAEALVSELDRLEEEHEDKQCVSCRARKYVQLKRIATPLLQQGIIEVPLFADLKSPGMSNNTKWTELRMTVSDTDIIAAMERKYPDLYREFITRECDSLKCTCPSKVFPVSAENIHLKRSDTASASFDDFESCLTDMDDLEEFENVNVDLPLQMSDEENEYKMTAVPRGICLTIQNQTFEKFCNRSGTDIDAAEIRSVFTKLQFTVDVRKDLSANEMIDVLHQYARKDHSEFDAFVCFILTHGTSDDHLIGCDGGSVSLDSLIAPFASSKCPTLAGKPKLFFINASRGTDIMYGHPQENYYLEEEEDLLLKEEITSVPNHADILIGHSTVQGYASFRSNFHGSKFIQTLTRILNTYGDDQDLLSCLAMVNRSVSNMRMVTSAKHFGGAKQVPAPMFTLTKKVHLTSDPLWPYPSEEAKP